MGGAAGRVTPRGWRVAVGGSDSGVAGRHVVVTGGSSGIGKAVAERYARAGARVTLIARRPDVLAAAAAEVGRCAAGGPEDVLGIPADVTRDAELAAAFEAATARFGVPAVLVCCAGVARADYFERLDAADFARAMATNFFGTVGAVRQVLAPMRAAGRGHLVLVSSGAALMGLFGYGAYGPSKFAVRGLAETLRAELVDSGVRVSVVYLPDVDTPQLAEENLTKPAELRAVAGSAAVWSARRAADVIVRGVRRGSFVVTGGATMRLLVYGHSALAPVLRLHFDRVVRRVRRSAAT
jgi:3-dehydrosphinganine reductase